MASLSEKRIYSERRGATLAFVAGEDGLTRVSVAGDRVGRFSLLHQEPTTDVAGGNGQLLVATHSDVLIGDENELVPAGFGRAAAVGVGPDQLLAAAPDGRVARIKDDRWRTLGTVESPRRFDGALLAAEDGVYRITDGLARLGLADVRDVAADGPLAATVNGIHRETGGTWTRVYDGTAVSRVAADGHRRHLVDDGALHAWRDGDWQACDVPVDEAVADVTYGEFPYAVTVDGTILVRAAPHATADGGTGWRHTTTGVSGCRAIAIA